MATQIFVQVPWNGGVNTNVDESLIDPNQLTLANNVSLGSASDGRQKRDGVNMDFDPDILEVHTVTTVADVSDSLDGKFFILGDGAATTVGFWIDTDDSGTSEPSHGADRGVEITGIATDDTAATVASVIQAVITGDSAFSATVLTNVITVTAAAAGDLSASSAGDSGFTVAKVNDGIADSQRLIRLHDTWFGTTASKTQKSIAVTDANNVFEYSTAGARTTLALDGSATAWSGTPSAASTEMSGNLLILASNVAASVLHKWEGTGNNIKNLGNNAQVETITTVADVGDSLDQTFFILFDDVGSVAFWYDTDDSGSSEPTHGADRSIEITTVVTGDSANTVADVTATAINADSKFGATDATNVVTVTHTPVGFRFSGNAGTSGFSSIVTVVGHEPPPVAGILRQYIGRLWTNDKTNADRIHYTTTADPEEFGGFGDSGILDIGIGDGDPSGITAIFPPFKGNLYVAKKRRLYRISGFFPETFSITLVSDGIGCVSHNAVVATENDIYFVSERGIHSLLATDKFGDTETAFISRDIQKTFNEDIDRTKLPRTQAVYNENINSVAFTFSQNKVTSDANFSGVTSSSVLNTVWMFNVTDGRWYRGYDSMPCDSIMSANDSDQQRLYLGSFNSRLIKTDIGAVDDTDFDGVVKSIPYKLSSARIFPDRNIYTQKAFKFISPIFRPPGVFTLTVQVDNQSVQSILYNEVNADLLDDTFILDQSVLGGSGVLSPFARAITGVGRSIKLGIDHDESGETVNVQGFVIEFEDAGVSYEVNVSG